MEAYQVRTDLVLEENESVQKKNACGINGVNVEEYDVMEDVHISEVVITSKNAARIMRKPMGTYITIEAKGLDDNEEIYYRRISKEIAIQIKKILPELQDEKSILVVGLGNREVTADSLGPCTVDNLMITRHIIKEYGKEAYGCLKMNKISSLVPGVMAKTGMETYEIVHGVINKTKPDIVIVIDALAARNTKRLNRTIQITDTGIHPGSGVGNHRSAITKESVGVTVVAIGIPMVVDAATIVGDAIDKVAETCPEEKMTLDLFKNNIDSNLHNMYVTAKNIDETTKKLSIMLSDAINMALYTEQENKKC